MPKWVRFEPAVFAILLLFPLIPGLEDGLFQVSDTSFLHEFTLIFIFAILALGLNVVVGNTGLLHLGIAAFFGIGAYIAGILTIRGYPFQIGFWPALAVGTGGAALLGLILGAPTLRLRGDYLALVTLGFGEVVRFSLRNLEEITNGTKALSPIPGPPDWMAFGLDWSLDKRPFYFLALFVLAAVVVALRNLENSRLGRAFVAIREDELAAQCMGLNVPRIKLSAFALGAGLAGLAGVLYATKLASTAQPDAYDFNRSIIMLCCIILGGLGSLRGTLLGVLILVGFDNIIAPIIDRQIQTNNLNPDGNRFLTFANWRLMIFGLALILIMRFRPEGLLPSSRVKKEMHEEKPEANA